MVDATVVGVVAVLVLVSGFVVLRRRRRYRYRHKYLAPATPAPPSGECWTPPDRVGDPLKGVYSPDRLRILSSCQVASGKVLEVRHEPDGDVHIRLSPDQLYSALPVQGQDFIICEIIPTDQVGGSSGLNVAEPQAGDHVTVNGPWCFDRIHGWNEIHPVWKLVVG